MAVRFLPSRPDSEEPSGLGRGEQSKLAEVIDLRARLPQVMRDPHAEHTLTTTQCADSSAPVSERDEAAANEVGASRSETETDTEHPRVEAVRLLARRALSSGELRRELARSEHTSELIEAVIEECIESLYLDDLGLARATAEKLRERKKASRSQIRVKLRERLLPDDVIESTLAEFDSEEEDALLIEIARDRARRMNGLERQVAERRLLGYLARRGWSGEPALRACRAALDETVAAGRTGVRFT